MSSLPQETGRVYSPYEIIIDEPEEDIVSDSSSENEETLIKSVADESLKAELTATQDQLKTTQAELKMAKAELGQIKGWLECQWEVFFCNECQKVTLNRVLIAPCVAPCVDQEEDVIIICRPCHDYLKKERSCQQCHKIICKWCDEDYDYMCQPCFVKYCEENHEAGSKMCLSCDNGDD
jgi:hypothetical protein